MKDKTLLHLFTILGIGGWAFLFRKGPIKDWFIIYLAKALVSTFLDLPTSKKKYVQYPIRYYPKIFSSNISFIYLLFPMFCVLYNQFTYKMKPLKTFFSVFLFSVPMALTENWLEKNTRLVKYGKGWNGFLTLSVYTFTFLVVRGFIAGIRFVDQMRNAS